MKPWIFLAAIALAGCKPTETNETDTDVVSDTDTDTDSDTDTDTDADTDTDTQEDCTAQVAAVSPIDNAVNVALDSDVVVTFTEAVGETDFSLTVDGVAGKSTLAADGLSATFDPDADLATSTEYNVTASACGGEASKTTFRTVDGPIEPDTLEGRTYALDMDDVTWEKPGIASVLKDYITAEYVLTQVLTFDDATATLDAVGAIGEDDGAGGVQQTACIDTFPYDDADFSGNPTFVAGPTLMSMMTDYGEARVEQFTVTATFAESGEVLVDIDITGRVDVRPFEEASGQDICSLSSIGFGEPCEKCDDGAKKCLPTHITADEAPWVPDLTIDPALAVCE